MEQSCIIKQLFRNLKVCIWYLDAEGGRIDQGEFEEVSVRARYCPRGTPG